ncbi:transcriptional regulator family: Fungal Specific TF [Penicillium crustosum]|uniref:transcriptional regulator family: Fungal Specific TF n=1 Tax=Penicillium crustosum TaxID=36656 RepID=UPI0023A696F9|nr:transcriptional regulator family: Fungal Specific TF [Penicillium crustosum]KAJ5410051.1 transcriptional regulator family: Fungal Specific TF [Penicillium crustosum]
MSESTSSQTMTRVPISSQRVVKPSAKRRRPPVGLHPMLPARCSKTGNADSCTYRGILAKSSSVNGMLSDDHSGSAGVVTTSSRTPVSLTENPGKPRASPDRNGKMTHLKGQETITKFYGCSYPLNFYQQFAELRSYIVQIKSKNPMINILRDEIYPLANDDYRLRALVHDTVIEDTLRQLIPTKQVADTLTQTYIERFEIIHRVLNISAFMADYNRHWASPLCTPTSFLVQFLLVAAAAASFHPEICINVMSQQTVRDHALDWIEAAESWLNSSTSQPPQSWDTLATHCLLLVAKRANYAQEDSFWTYTGTLVRWAMAAGYHRESPSTARISPYYREMRRRLWMTIVELDIQASVERGMPPSVRMEDFNIKSPLNIDDDKLQESGQDPLEGMPLATFTDTSFQAHMYRSLPVRLKVCAFVNGCYEQDDFDRVLHLGEELEEALQDIPEWSTARDNPRQQKTTMYTKRLLSIHLHQYTVLLHIQFAIQATPSFKSAICQRARLEASLKILDHHQKLIQDEKVPEQACRAGLILAVINVCHEIYKDFGSHATMAIFPQVSTFLVATVEQAQQMLEKRLSLTFHGLNEYYLLSMILGLIKSKLWPESRAMSDKEAADRVIQICIKLQTRWRAVIQSDHSLLGSIDNGGLRGLNLPEDASSMIPDGAELLGSMFLEDLGFIDDSTGYGFFLV